MACARTGQGSLSPAVMQPDGQVWPSPQHELLLRAALLPQDDALAAWSQWTAENDLLTDHIDGGSFRLFPLVYKNLFRHGCEDPLMRRLKGIYRYSWGQNVKLFATTREVLSQLTEAGIDTMVLKGAALSELHYQDRGTRPMSDIDLLVPTAKAQETIDLLLTQGWKFNEAFTPGDLVCRWSVGLINDADQELDLHWHVFRECLYLEADDELWAHSVPLKIQGVATRTICPADMLLHTIIHGIRWNPLPTVRWVVDSTVIIRQEGNDQFWDRLLSQARQRGLLYRLGKGLTYLHTTLNLPIPDQVLQECADIRPSFIERIEYRQIHRPWEQVNQSGMEGNLQVLIEYARLTRGQRIGPRAANFPRFLQHRFDLPSRRALLPELCRRVPRKLARMVKQPTGNPIAK